MRSGGVATDVRRARPRPHAPAWQRDHLRPLPLPTGARLPRWVLLLAARLLFLALALCHAASRAVDEAAVLLALREASFAMDPAWMSTYRGWDPHAPHQLHHCLWGGVQCSSEGRVTHVSLAHSGNYTEQLHPPWHASSSATGLARPVAATDSSPLLPELARLPRLQEFKLFTTLPLPGSLPPEWFLPGAFPSLTALFVKAYALGSGGLPGIPPGAMLALRSLVLHFSTLQASLPASWGSAPEALPQLEELSLGVGLLAGALPPEWAKGFVGLKRLIIRGATSEELGRLPHPSASGLALRLPPEWAGGFRSLEQLNLVALNLVGSLPPEWFEEGSFPKLIDLTCSNNALSGPLPQAAFRSTSPLELLSCKNNSLTGTLPAAWAHSNAEIIMLADNALNGPAFPGAWTQPGAMSQLNALDVSGNPGLTGTLPDSLDWPNLQLLRLNGTGVDCWAQHGAKPSAECTGSEIEHHGGSYVLASIREKGRLAGDAERGPLGSALARASGTWLELLLLLLLLLSTILAGGALRIHLGRRRMQPQQRQLPQGLSIRGSGSQLRPPTVPAGSRSSRATSHEAARVALSRRSRLAALLSAELGVGRRVNIPQVQAPPDELAHRLGIQASREAAADHQPLLTGASLSASARGRAWADGWHIECGGSSGGGGEGSESCDASWQWCLDTHSLQLEPSQLEIVADSGGELVVLGEGGHAVVLAGRLLSSGSATPVAVKVFELHQVVNAQTIWREASLMRLCVHERIVPCYGVAIKGPLLMVAMELMQGGSLKAARQQPEVQQQLHWNARGCQVALDVAEALDFLHSDIKVLHGDLKCSNVLLSADYRAEVADLGVSLVLGSQVAATAVGYSRMYAAPELLMGSRSTLASDMYSFGVLLIELLTQELGSVRGDWRLPHAPQECPQAVVGLIQECIAADAARRPTAAEALRRLQAASAGAVPPGAPPRCAPASA